MCVESLKCDRQWVTNNKHTQKINNIKELISHEEHTRNSCDPFIFYISYACKDIHTFTSSSVHALLNAMLHVHATLSVENLTSWVYVPKKRKLSTTV